MSHISKGDIHAYLDGALGAYSEEAAQHVRAHLDACRSCAQLLEGEMRLRKEASAILAASAQGPVELDPLEELLARAAALDRQEGAESVEGAQGAEGSERTGSAQPSLGSRMYSFRWAATVVISLGAGWMAREVAGPAGDAERVPIAEPAVREIGVRSSDEQVLQAPTERREREIAGRLSEAEAQPQSPSAVGAAADGPGPDRGAVEFDDDALLDQVETVSARQRAESAVTRGVGPADVSGVTAQAVEPQVEPIPASDDLRRSALATDRRDATLQFNNEEPRASAREETAPTPFLVPGLPVRDVRLAPKADGTVGQAGGSVVVTQELEDGRIIELEFVPMPGAEPLDGNATVAGSDPVIGGAFQERSSPLGRTRPEGWGSVRREVPGGVAVLSGPLAESELEELLDRALGPR